MIKHCMNIGWLFAVLLSCIASPANAEYCAEVRYTNNNGGYGFALRNFPNSQLSQANAWLPGGFEWSGTGQDAWLTARYVRSGWCDEQVDNSCSTNQTLCGGDMKTFEMLFWDECDMRNYMYGETFGEGIDYTSGYYFAGVCN